MSEAQPPSVDVNAYVDALKRQRNAAADREALLSAQLADAMARLRQAETKLAADRRAEEAPDREAGGDGAQAAPGDSSPERS